MAISLIKGQKISLKKETGETLTKVMVGLGWDPVKRSGWAALLPAAEVDLDASCLMFDGDKQVVDAVFFNNLRRTNGSIVHQGDNRTGEGDGDDEQIFIYLTRVSANVQTIVITITSYEGQTFDKIENAFCRLIDTTSNKEIARYTLSGAGKFTANIMAKLYRHNGEWKMQAVGEPCYGKTVKYMIPVVAPTL